MEQRRLLTVEGAKNCGWVIFSKIFAEGDIPMSEPLIRRVWAMPAKHTFSIPLIASFLRDEVAGEWADPFCGLFSPATIRNDADESKEADHHLDGLDFLRQLQTATLDGVLFDPPYSTEQALRKYKPIQNGTAGRAEYWAKCKDEIARLVKPEGKAICFAWDSTGVGKKRGFELLQVLLVCHGACHNDTIITVERKMTKPQRGLFT